MTFIGDPLATFRRTRQAGRSPTAVKTVFTPIPPHKVINWFMGFRPQKAREESEFRHTDTV